MADLLIAPGLSPNSGGRTRRDSLSGQKRASKLCWEMSAAAENLMRLAVSRARCICFTSPGSRRTALPSRQSPDPVAAPPVAGLDLQLGADASSQMAVSWHARCDLFEIPVSG